MKTFACSDVIAVAKILVWHWCDSALWKGLTSRNVRRKTDHSGNRICLYTGSLYLSL